MLFVQDGLKKNSSIKMKKKRRNFFKFLLYLWFYIITNSLFFQVLYFLLNGCIKNKR